MPWQVSADVARYDEAVDWFQKRTVITGDDALVLGTKLRTEAFWIGGGLQLEQVQRVFDKMVPALEKGIPFDEWRKSVKSELRNDAHAETVFRNACQRSYNAGRYAQMTEPSTVKFRPFWMYDSILDGRTTPICTVCNKVIREAGDAWWNEHYPPQHHRCRASVRNLRATEAERRGGVTETPPTEKASGTWGLRPGLSPVPKPSRKTKDPTLVTALGKKEAKAKVRVPKPPAQHTPEHWEKHYTAQYGAEASKAVGWGRAAQERGLDMPVDQLIKQLEKLKDLDMVVVDRGLERARDVKKAFGPKATFREHAADIHPLYTAAAGVAGHLEMVDPRKTAVRHPDVEQHDLGRKALGFFTKMTPERTAHPTAYNVVRKPGTEVRAYFSESDRQIVWNPDRGILEHEWAHGLEHLNPALETRAVAYLKARTDGEKTVKLADVQPGKGYDDNEYARPDGFLDPYMGKRYVKKFGPFGKDADLLGATEITSMGVEVLVAGARGWGTLRRLLEKDPDTFWFTLGQLAHP